MYICIITVHSWLCHWYTIIKSDRKSQYGRDYNTRFARYLSEKKHLAHET